MDPAVGLAAGAFGVWAATGGRVVARRRDDEEPPSSVSEMSIAPFTSPKGPAPPLLGAGVAWVGLEFVLSCILLNKEGT